MINFKLIYKILGSLLLLEAMFILVCIGVSLFYHEDDIMDITTDIKMLQTTLASKGLLDSDFDI